MTATHTAHDAPAAPPLDKRRINEMDPDYRRLHAQVERSLWAGIHAYVRALRETPASSHDKAASTFITHQAKALQLGYLAGHWEGERDYWHALSARHTPQAHTALSQAHGVEPNVQRMRRTLMFYGAASIAKMAREGEAAWRADQWVQHLSETFRLDAKANAAMDAWLHGLTARVALSADVTWTGMQDGYLAAGTVDPANPYAYVWWELEPGARHCGDCPGLAAASPYTAPGSGGNELPQTPGDGGTECGGACKCTLQWGSSQHAYESSDYAPEVAKSWHADMAGMPTPSQHPSLPALPEGMGTRAAPTTQMPPTPSAPSPTDPWQGIADTLAKAGTPLSAAPAEPSQMWQAIADALAPGQDTPTGKPGQQSNALAPADGQLNEGQKAALDLYRKAALAWDEARGASLPPLDVFTSESEWQSFDMAQLTPEQVQAYAQYIESVNEWVDSSPIDE